MDAAVGEELKIALAEALSTGLQAHVRWDEATYLDVTAVQLLWAAVRDAAGRDIRLIFDSPMPENVRSVLADAGFPGTLFEAEAVSTGEMG
jgi:hypothetical protein